MNETLFYVFGAALVVLALTVSAIGIRSEGFPSGGVMRATVLLFAVLVGGTAVFGVANARDEQAERRHENELAAREAERAAEEEEAATQEEAGGGGAGGAAGEEAFAQFGCGSCHTLAAADATGEIGPDLDQALRGRPESFIRRAIVEPNAEIAQGFSPDVMPQTFGDQIPPDQLDALVQFLAQGTQGG